MDTDQQKGCGAYYTPDDVVRSLVCWAVRRQSDRLLDPACGDGRFLVAHCNSVGVEQDAHAAKIVHSRAPGCLMHQGNFFEWADQTRERFDCAAGNPPFIRYQRFAGETRRSAIHLCAKHGAQFSSLSSSWAPFIVATATLLKPGGRMAFVVPAEIGHAPYAKPAMDFLVAHFARVQLVAVQRKIFPQLSEDCWLLYAEGFGGKTERVLLSPLTQFGFMRRPPAECVGVRLDEWRRWKSRLRPFLLPSDILRLYEEVARSHDSVCLMDVAKVGIGYVTGNNKFFHFRPSEAEQARIPSSYLQPTVRSGRMLTGRAITKSNVRAWKRRDEPNFLLRVAATGPVPKAIRRYLDSEAGRRARSAYKCRHRRPWYTVPDVVVPDAFLTYMSGRGPALVANRGGCSGTNSVHMIRLNGSMRLTQLQDAWAHSFTELSCEIEGHPLGGGMLKLEPREAGRVVLTRKEIRLRSARRLVRQAITTMRQWRHCD